ncbi:hypothetical protein ACT8ZV_14770 [Nocardioides sp. MAHUQ-72]|uniref:hypothetical protein n=1 Tax=unclassified Nocardioides TaxID=2615069 RepID=UPI003622854D
MTGPVRGPRLTGLPEVRFGLAEAAVVVTATVCHRVGADARTGTVALAVVAVASCLTLPARFTVGVALSAWAFLTGFLVHAGGQLTFRTADLDRLGLLLLLCLAATATSAAVRAAPRLDGTREGDLVAGSRR